MRMTQLMKMEMKMWKTLWKPNCTTPITRSAIGSFLVLYWTSLRVEGYMLPGTQTVQPRKRGESWQSTAEDPLRYQKADQSRTEWFQRYVLCTKCDYRYTEEQATKRFANGQLISNRCSFFKYAVHRLPTAYDATAVWWIADNAQLFRKLERHSCIRRKHFAIKIWAPVFNAPSTCILMPSSYLITGENRSDRTPISTIQKPLCPMCIMDGSGVISSRYRWWTIFSFRLELRYRRLFEFRIMSDRYSLWICHKAELLPDVWAL